jgi:hypothetical protein
MPLAKKLGFSLVASAVAGVVLLGVGELYVRLTKEHLDLRVLTGQKAGADEMAEWAKVDAFCAYRGRPGRYPVADNIVKTVNSDGFISTPELGHAKEPGEVRIAFLGGSSTDGSGHLLGDRQTWPWKVVDILRSKSPGRKVTFLNCAAAGYSSFESYGRLWSRVRFYNPDIVVVYHGWNEMYYFSDIALAHRWRVLWDGGWGFDFVTNTVVKPMWFDPVLQYSQTLIRVRRRLGRIDSGERGRAVAAGLQQDFDQRALEVWRTNLRLLAQVSEMIHAKLFVCKQATLVVPNLPKELRAKCHYEYHGFGHDAHVAAFSGIYRIIDEEIPAERIIDVTPLSGRPELFFDHIHPKETGTSAIAEIVAEALLKVLNEGGEGGASQDQPPTR